MPFRKNYQLGFQKFLDKPLDSQPIGFKEHESAMLKLTEQQRATAIDDRLIVFTRYPQPGKTKTRLIPALGAEGAATLQRQMTEHSLTQLLPLVEQGAISLEVRFAGGTRWQMARWLGRELAYRTQGSGNLGDRLIRAFEGAFRLGIERVAIIGIDCPNIDSALLVQAFEALHQHDLVLGPAHDGGYYLIGLRRPMPELLTDIAWGSDGVLQQTLAKAESLKLSVAYLRTQDDVDRPEDLTIWEEALARRTQTQKISAIVPVLNEAQTIAQTLLPLKEAANVEVIVVDGGSGDRTREIVQSLGVRVISTDAGRAQQMNAGAEVATGEILLFLHADTQLPTGFEATIRSCLSRPNTIAGAFELQIDADLRGLRTIEKLVNWRSLVRQMPYGDQALFLPKPVFQDLGGFAPMPIMEDFEFVQRLKRQGRIAIAPVSVLTSGRRWQKLGVLNTTLLNQFIIIAYFLGVPPTRLARWYRGSPHD